VAREVAQTYTTRGQVTAHPLPVAVTLLLVAEHLLELVAESEVQSLGREVPDDVGRVTTPQGEDTLVGGSATEAVDDAIVATVKTARLDHLILRRELDAELLFSDGDVGSAAREALSADHT